MAEERPEKQTIRDRWITEVVSAEHDGAEPLYLTLCGAEGYEISMLIDRGILRLTETGAIDDRDADRVVAVESRAEAAVTLRQRFPGLKLRAHPVEQLVQHSNPMSWPRREDRTVCRALHINLDFNKSLSGSMEAGRAVFRDLDVMRKLATIHSTPTPLNWKLFVTFNAAWSWGPEVELALVEFLRENFEIDADFAHRCREFLGEEVFESIKLNTLQADSIDDVGRQRILMVFVPKKIAELVHTEGWLVRTTLNWHYGGYGNVAPMVTWMFAFEWDGRASGSIYRDSRAAILEHTGSVTSTGTVD